MISKIKNLIKISFVKDVSILQIGKFFTMVLTTAGSIVLARLLQPELYGIYGLIFAFVGLISIFMGWGGEFATLTLLAGSYAKADRDEIRNVLIYFVKITLLPIVSIGVLSVVFAPLLTGLLYQNSQIGYLARVVLLAGFLNILYAMLNIVLQAIRKIKQLAILEVSNKFFDIFLPVIFVLLGWGLLGLVWGYFIAAFVFSIVAFFAYNLLAKKDQLLPSFKKIMISLREIRLKKYLRFGLSIAVDKNLGNLGALLPVLFLGIFALPEQVGYFKIAFGYITLPTLVLSSISRLLTVQLPKSQAYGRQILKEHFFKTAIYSGLISLLLVAPLVVLAPFLIKLFYGVQYLASIKLVYFMAILTVFSGFGVGLGAFYRTVHRMKISIGLNIFNIVLLSLFILFLVRICSPIMAVIWSLIIVGLLSLSLHFLIVGNIFKKQP